MATSLHFKVRSSRDNALIASCALLSDATVIACRHGNGTKISHMHFGVLATVGILTVGYEASVFNAATQKLDDKRKRLLAEHERSLEQERQRRLARASS
jgi:hypothetical protein